MRDFLSMAKSFLADRKGVTALEYGIIAGVISIGVIGGASAIGGKVTGYVTAIKTAMGI
jgi:pilus assembly protein Flp/PilA